MKIRPLLFFLYCGGIPVAFSQRCSVIAEIPGFRHPESVAFDGRHFFVSNVGSTLAPLEKDGDGYISRLTRTGALQDSSYFPSVRLHAPKGMVVLNELLYVADVGRIVVLDIRSRRLVREKDLSAYCSFVNDLAARDEERLFFTCSDKNTVMQWDIAADSVITLNPDPIPGANGLSWDFLNGDLYVAGMGASGKPGFFYKLDVKGRNLQNISSLEGFWDGLHLVRGQLLGTDWKTGRLYSVNLKTGLETILDCGKVFSGPADFLYQQGKIYLPAMKEGKLYVLRVD
ncbi:MAG: hypothetical protein N2110_02360 [Flavobacteriales bacterium]|nr:hypothetical protein [Flavobacteriales bacterium]MCX7767851.1 hypothetical protein [Flavobacteriales bacterium]MDW8410651.1 hypothetical protein [Flavobacteriales bacterium]